MPAKQNSRVTFQRDQAEEKKRAMEAQGCYLQLGDGEGTPHLPEPYERNQLQPGLSLHVQQGTAGCLRQRCMSLRVS